jgi:hypothetical protein
MHYFGRKSSLLHKAYTYVVATLGIDAAAQMALTQIELALVDVQAGLPQGEVLTLWPPCTFLVWIALRGSWVQ